MITGDHPATALAIARELGVAERREEVLAGPEIEEMTDDALEARVPSVLVCARTSPEQKLRIVRAWKARGEVVAMTGDGVNDAPALEAADIGVAMGRRGTDVARESAALVLVDDDFGAIVEAARIGRGIFDNMRRAFGYIVAVHIPIAGLALIPALLGWPALIGPIQVVFLELIIDPACTIVFELEPPDEAIMDRPPRGPKEHLLEWRGSLFNVLQGLVVLASALALVLVLGAQGASADVQKTAAFVALVLGNIAILVASRSATEPFWRTFGRANRALPILVVAVFAALTLAIYVPPIADMLGLSALGLGTLALANLFGLVPVLALDVVETMVRRGPRTTG